MYGERERAIRKAVRIPEGEVDGRRNTDGPGEGREGIEVSKPKRVLTVIGETLEDVEVLAMEAMDTFENWMNEVKLD